MYEEATDRDPDRMRALQSMRQLWSSAGGYFPPGSQMPAPEFAPEFGVPHARVGEDEKWIGVPPQLARALGRQKRLDNDDAEATLLHEWAHAHQSPATLANGQLREGSAEAFALALAPVAARRGGRDFLKGRVRHNVYAPERRAAERRGPGFILRGQFR